MEDQGLPDVIVTQQTGGSSASGIKRKLNLEDLVDTVPGIVKRVSIENPAAVSAGYEPKVCCLSNQQCCD